MPTVKEPVISVVIPTFNRCNLLINCLLALEQQTFPFKNFEIIVVDDGSTDQTENMVGDFIKKTKSNCKYYKIKHSGPSRARNKGIEMAKGEIIAFTDDDCIPAPDWLENIYNTFILNRKLLAVGGKTITFNNHITPFSHWIEDDHPYSFPSCNIAVLKNVLIQINGFDENLFPNEDWDLVFKIRKIGKIIYNPKVIVIHPPVSKKFFYFVKKLKNLDTEFILFKKHKELYKSSVQKNPWRVIYYHHFFVQAYLKLKRFRKLIFKKPLLFIKFLTLLITQRLYLLILFPHFLKKYFEKQSHFNSSNNYILFGL